jgi:hypothetical protein
MDSAAIRLDRESRYDKITAMAGHPLVREWHRDSEAQRTAGLGRTTRSALLAAGEKMIQSMVLLLSPDDLIKRDDGTAIDRAGRRVLSEATDAAACYWIPADLDRMIQGMPLPRHVLGRRKLPHPTMWICPELSHGPDEVTIDSILIRVETYRGKEGIWSWLWGDTSNGSGPPNIVIQAGFMPWGSRFPEDIPDGSFGAMILKLLAFLDSPYTDTVRHRSTRSERRAIEKAGYEEPTVHVVRLRTPIRNAVETTNESGRDIHYRHRWWVRGHFRAQWYASQKAHQVIWIAPHIKGPEDAEFKASAYAVVR